MEVVQEHEKYQKLRRLLEKVMDGSRMLIFSETKKGCDNVSQNGGRAWGSSQTEVRGLPWNRVCRSDSIISLDPYPFRRVMVTATLGRVWSKALMTHPKRACLHTCLYMLIYCHVKPAHSSGMIPDPLTRFKGHGLLARSRAAEHLVRSDMPPPLRPSGCVTQAS